MFLFIPFPINLSSTEKEIWKKGYKIRIHIDIYTMQSPGITETKLRRH